MPCTADVCDQATGACSNPLPTAATACDDGNPCTQPGTCTGADCKPGPPVTCDDGNACTDDACVKGVGCTKKALDQTPCDDGDPCSLYESCKAGTCAAAGKKNCLDANACTLDICTPGKGCLFLPATLKPCDDNNACTGGDLCTNSATCSGTQKSCNDGNPCTNDACHPIAGCQFTAFPADPAKPVTCEDGNACTAVSACGNGKCLGVPMSTPACIDGVACTADGCDCQTGCVHPPVPCATFTWSGYKYKNSKQPRTSGGVKGASFKSSATPGKSKLTVKVQDRFSDPPLTAPITPGVVVQLLVTDGFTTECFKTTFTATPTKQNTTDFKIKGP
jgi:hypothetical protein